MSERDFNINHKFKKNYDFGYIDSLVSSFLGDLNPVYLDYYNTRKADGSFIFNDDRYGDAYSTYDDERNVRVIFISLTKSANAYF